MKIMQLLTRRTGLSLLGLVLPAAFAWMIARFGPLAPVRVTTVTVGEGGIL